MRGVVPFAQHDDSVKLTDFHAGRSGSPMEGGLALQFLLRGMFVVSSYITSAQLHRVSVWAFVAMVLLLSAALLNGLYRPWQGRRLTRKSVLGLLECGALHLIILLAWGFGLKTLGPIRTLLVEGAELPIYYLFTYSFRGSPASSRKVRAMTVLLCAYLLVALDATWSIPSREINTRMVSGVRTHIQATTRHLHNFRHHLPHRKLLALDAEFPDGDIAGGDPPQAIHGAGVHVPEGAEEVAGGVDRAVDKVVQRAVDDAIAAAVDQAAVGAAVAGAVEGAVQDAVGGGVADLAVNAADDTSGGATESNVDSADDDAADDGDNAEAELGRAEARTGPFLGTAAVAFAGLTRQAMAGPTGKLNQALGSGKRQVSLSFSFAALLAMPVAVISSLAGSHQTDDLGGVLHGIPGALLAASFMVVLPQHLEQFTPRDTIMQWIAASTVLFGLLVSNAIFGYDSDGGVSWILACAFPLSCAGLWYLLDKDRRYPTFPELEVGGITSEFSAWTNRARTATRHLRAYVKDTRKDHESWQLFSFLVFQGLMVLVEAVYGRFTSSLGLLTVSSDTLLCCCALCISLAGTRLASTKHATHYYSYGMERLEPLCAFVNCVVLVFVGILVLLESVERSIEGALVEENRVLVITAIGCLFNVLGLVFFPLTGSSLNVRSAFLHILGNTMASGGLFLSTAIKMVFNVYWVDGVISSIVAVVVFGSALPPMIAAADCLALAVPRSRKSEYQKCRGSIAALDHVVKCDSFHLWSLTSTRTVISVRVVVDEERHLGHVEEMVRALVIQSFPGSELVIQVINEQMLHLRHANVT